MMQNRVGQQFGNYRLLHLLGRGGFAEVYLGEHVYMQSKAAVKVLYGPLVASDAQRFLQEARTLVSLEHPHIVGIKEFDINEDIPFLIMNYAPNGTLRQRHTKGQPVPLGTIVSYVLQVASALQFAHNRHIVHRDVKPENMLIDTNNHILLSDFGIAVLSSSTHSYGSKGQAGTYPYMAPEQITGKVLPASDQYALGITVYEWLCGETPFVGSAAEITAKHLHVAPPLFREKGIAIEPEVEAVIRRSLEKDPSQRFTSVQEFGFALQSSSQTLRHDSAHVPIIRSEDSIVASPPEKTSGFTQKRTPSSATVPDQSDSPAPPNPFPLGKTPLIIQNPIYIPLPDQLHKAQQNATSTPNTPFNHGVRKTDIDPNAFENANTSIYPPNMQPGYPAQQPLSTPVPSHSLVHPVGRPQSPYQTPTIYPPPVPPVPHALSSKSQHSHQARNRLLFTLALVLVVAVGIPSYLLWSHYVSATPSHPNLVAPSPTLGAPPNNAHFAITVAAQTQYQDGNTTNSTYTLVIDQGRVCTSRDAGQSIQTHEQITTTQGPASETDTATYSCSGTYQNGQITYTETLLTDSSSVTTASGDQGACDLLQPSPDEYLVGNYNQGKFSGTLLFYNFPDSDFSCTNATHSLVGGSGTWIGSLIAS